MRLYYLSIFKRLGVADSIPWEWDTKTNYPVYVHPDLDFHYINGECLLRNNLINFIKLEPGETVSDVSGPCFFLAANGHKADKMLYRTK